MNQKHTLNELNTLSRDDLITIILTMQGQLDTLNENIEKRIEQVRIASQHRFGRRTETMKSIDGQLSFFDEVDALYDENADEPEEDKVIPAKPHKKKATGQRDIDLKDFPEEIIPTHAVSEEVLDLINANCWVHARREYADSIKVADKLFHDSVKGAQASAIIYSISEIAKLNNLRPYYYFKHLLTELPKLCNEKGNIDSTKLDYLLPWAAELPKECRKPRR